MRLASQQKAQVVLLQTLKAKVGAEGLSDSCRLSNSRGSFVISEVLGTLNCWFIQEETFTVGVFGRQKTGRTLRRLRMHIFVEKRNQAFLIKTLEINTAFIERIPTRGKGTVTEMQIMGLDTTALITKSI